MSSGSSPARDRGHGTVATLPAVSEQARYQVRFDWAATGAQAVGADADVIVWVDAIASPGARLDVDELPGGSAVVEASWPTAGAVARWVIDLQQARRARMAIAVIAAGERRADGSLRFAVEDLLAAGAVIDQLAEVGLDASSPEAAAAEAAHRGLARSLGHLLTACVTAGTTPPPPGATRRRDDLGPADVVVRRPYPAS